MRQTRHLMVLVLLMFVALPQFGCAAIKNTLKRPKAQTVGTYDDAASRRNGYPTTVEEAKQQRAQAQTQTSAWDNDNPCEPVSWERDASGSLVETAQQRADRLDACVVTLDAQIDRLQAQIRSGQSDPNAARTIANLQAQIESLRSQTHAVSEKPMAWKAESGDTLRGIYFAGGFSTLYSFPVFFTEHFQPLNPSVTDPDHIIADRFYNLPPPPPGTIVIHGSKTTISSGVPDSKLQERIDALKSQLETVLHDKAEAEAERDNAKRALAGVNASLEQVNNALTTRTKERDGALAALVAAGRHTWRFWVGLALLIALIIIAMLLSMSRRRTYKKYEKTNDDLIRAEREVERTQAKLKASEEAGAVAVAAQKKAEAQRDQKDIDLLAVQQENQTLRTQFVELETVVDNHFVKFELRPEGEGQMLFDDISGKNRKFIYLPKWEDGFVRVGKAKVGSSTAAIAEHFKKNEDACTKHEIAFAIVTPVDPKAAEEVAAEPVLTS